MNKAHVLNERVDRHIDVLRVGKRMNKAHVLNERVEEHRFPTTEKEQQTLRWSVCTHNILYYSVI